MNNMLNFFIAILVVGWLIGFVALDAGGLIHMLLVVRNKFIKPYVCFWRNRHDII